ncbi:radical SAM family heme chaperone HemW [Lachnospiraceae bacterium ZAX-1]
MNRNKLELYVHIPFCIKKCDYCDFLSAPASLDVQQEYVKRLTEEIKQKADNYQAYSVPSIFIGGGTPSVLPISSIDVIMKALSTHFKLEDAAEITIECNPGTLDEDKVKFYKKVGINRISFGLQSAIDEELNVLGRIHTWEQFLKSFALVREAGFDNVNVDLMYGLPNQSLKDWIYSITQVVRLNPEHICAYSLIIEEGTNFFKRYQEDEKAREKGDVPVSLPEEETERRMCEHATIFLRENGYEQYEISNYAKPGKSCKHNIGYWTRQPYLGLGLGSASLVENRRFTNTANLEDYLKGDFGKKDCETLSEKSQMEEFMFLGLRLLRGVDRQEFKKQFSVEIEHIYGEVLVTLSKQELLRQIDGRIWLTTKGISISNYAMAQFLL